MKKTLICFVLVVPAIAMAQLPGDFNCSGSVNGLDIPHLFSLLSQGLLDTTTCTWDNGDLNYDGLYHTVADWRQIFYYVGQRPPDSPPWPFDIHLLTIESAVASPGDTVDLAINAIMADTITDIMIHVETDRTYLLDWMPYDLPCVRNGWYRGDELFCWEASEDIEGGYFLPDGYTLLGHLRFFISSDCPPGTTIPIDFSLDRYYPNGFANFSYPTYFVRPGMVGGTILVEASAVDDNPEVPDYALRLSGYPNPFNARIAITVDGSDDAAIFVYDIAGRRVAELRADGGMAVWNAVGYSSGIYFARAVAGDRTSPPIKLIYQR
jgi:hypothetical protein